MNNLEMDIVHSLSNLDRSPGATVDEYIANTALELGLPIVGLESAEQVLDIYFNAPFNVMVARIMSFLPRNDFLANHNEYPTSDDLINYYENNKIESTLDVYVIELGVHIECIYRIYVREKVSNWRSTYYANEIVRLLQETEEPSTFFVAVGLSHIIRSRAGEEFTDIIQQLEFAGFATTPLY